MNFFGLMNFQAPYLPWILFAFSLLLGNSIIVDLMGIVVGHVYYFLEDVFPREQGGFRILKTPQFLYVFSWSTLNQPFWILFHLGIGCLMKDHNVPMNMRHVRMLKTTSHSALVVSNGSDSFSCHLAQCLFATMSFFVQLYWEWAKKYTHIYIDKSRQIRTRVSNLVACRDTRKRKKLKC